MKLPFTKMHGAGNDFVVLDATRARQALSPAQYRFLADRRFGIGADQILVVEPGNPATGTDFTYRIFNADGGEVEQCGNGARCFARFVHDTGLTPKVVNGCELWPIQLANHPVDVAVVSMGNPHAVMRVDSTEHAPVDELGPQVEGHAR